jgi:hypothetical protein
MKLTLAIVVLVAGLSACGGSSSSSKSSSSSSSSPPSMDTLIARATALKVKSMNADIATSVPGAATGAATQTLAGTVSMQLQPSLAGSFRFSVGGQTLLERIVGTMVYLNLPSIAAHDGGRPWVAFDISAASAATGIDLNELLQDARNADPTSTLRLLAAKRLFHETGPSTLAGQRVIGLTGSFTPENLPSTGLLSAKLQAQLKAKLTQLGATREDVTTYLAYSGEPVKIVTTLVTAAHGTITSTVNVHGINIPVVVAAPPKAQTISLAQLKKLPPSA